MPSKNPRLALQDILQNIRFARSFAKGLSLEDFLDDQKTIYAVTRALEIISEATRKLPESIFNRYPEGPWADIKGSGNVYRHDYESVLEHMIWETVSHALEPLEEAVTSEIAALGKDAPEG